MPVSERQKAIRKVVSMVRAQMHQSSGDDELSNIYRQADNLAELLAILTAQARAEQADETVWVEITLEAASISREGLEEAESTLASLGYSKVTPVLRRLAKRARPRPPTFAERWQTARRCRAT
jgi:DNA-binding protein H-NS